MKTTKIFIDGMELPKRFRKINDEHVAQLAESMKAIGLQQPISVWTEKDENGVTDVHLVAGAHRLLAAQKLGWDEIDAIVVDMTDANRRRWEIAENLHRAELTALERSEHVAEWIRLTEQTATEATQIGIADVRDPDQRASRKGRAAEKVGQIDPLNRQGRGRKSGVRQAARELNIQGKTDEARRMNARRALQVDSLTPEAKEAAVEVGLDDNRTALLAAAKAAPEKQAEVLREIATEKEYRKQVTAELPRPVPGTNQAITPAELTQIRLLGDFDLIMLISEIHDHGWPTAKKLLPLIDKAEKVSRERQMESVQ